MTRITINKRSVRKMQPLFYDLVYNTTDKQFVSSSVEQGKVNKVK